MPPAPNDSIDVRCRPIVPNLTTINDFLETWMIAEVIEIFDLLEAPFARMVSQPVPDLMAFPGLVVCGVTSIG
jgi:hypothetical protein